MKRFSVLLLAAVLGSLLTLGAYQYFFKPELPVTVQYVNDTPISRIALTKDENGNLVPLDFTVVAEKVTPTVVHIKSIQRTNTTQPRNMDPFRDFFGPHSFGPSQSSGSGVIINANGYIVTNNHVVKDADVVEVTLFDNRTFKAEVIGTDPDTDLAVVKINQSNLQFLSFVDSDKSKVGEWVLAVGNPFNLNSTVTAGIISAKGRNIDIINRGSNEGNTAIESFIQTDAAINPGNSGGALVNLSGGLLGINTAIASPTGAYSGYGFAVPSNIVSKIVEDLIKFGTVQRGWLGVTITSLTSQLARQHSLEITEGALVTGFADKSSAKDAGMKENDVVVKIDNTPIKTSAALTEIVGRHRPGDKLMITVNRAGKEMTLPVVLKNREGEASIVKPEDKPVYATLGVVLEDLDPKTLKQLDLNNGVRVKSLGNGKLARFTDIREGFIITKVNDEPVKSVKEFNELLKKKKEGELVILTGTYEDFPREFNYAFRM